MKTLLILAGLAFAASAGASGISDYSDAIEWDVEEPFSVGAPAARDIHAVQPGVGDVSEIIALPSQIDADNMLFDDVYQTLN